MFAIFQTPKSFGLMLKQSLVTYKQKNPIPQSQNLKYLFPKLQFLFRIKSGVYISNGHFPHEPTSQEIFSDGGSKLLTLSMCFTVDVILCYLQTNSIWLYLAYYYHTKEML